VKESQGLKPGVVFTAVAARLKSCPKKKLTVMIPSPLRGLGHCLRAFPGPRYACPGLFSTAPPGPDLCDGLVDAMFHSSWSATPVDDCYKAASDAPYLSRIDIHLPEMPAGYSLPASSRRRPGAGEPGWEAKKTIEIERCFFEKSGLVERGRGRPRYSRPGGRRYRAIAALRNLSGL